MIVFTFTDPITGKASTHIARSGTYVEIDHAETVNITNDGMFIDGVLLEEYQKRKQKNHPTAKTTTCAAKKGNQ